jgi:hypothetical protein
MSEKILVRYIRQFPSMHSKGEPIGCVVAIDKDRIGYAVCNPCDKFDKVFGKEIAAGRAALGHEPYVANRVVGVLDDGSKEYLDELLSQELDAMKDRAKRYFADAKG